MIVPVLCDFGIIMASYNLLCLLLLIINQCQSGCYSIANLRIVHPQLSPIKKLSFLSAVIQYG